MIYFFFGRCCPKPIFFASCERATGKAEDVKFIARFIIEDQKGVGVDDFVDQPFAEHATLPPVVFAGADARVIMDDLGNALLCDWRHALSGNDHIGGVEGA